MFHRIQQYPLMTAEGRTYRPRVYGNLRPDELWDGWLVFFPVDGAPAIASDRETTQPSFHALTAWASGLNDVYLAAALDRAVRIAEQPPVLGDLARAEYQALADADELSARAEVERLAAASDAAAAQAARAEAREIASERVATAEAVAALEETAANAEADVRRRRITQGQRKRRK
jgi:hypothetical protein